MEKKIMINGMMCAHCTAHVEKALGTLEGVASVKADLEGKCATVTSIPAWRSSPLDFTA